MNINTIVEEYGWFVAKFEATKYLPSFVYTIGLWKTFQHPELIIFGLQLQTMHEILNIGGELVREHKIPKIGEITDNFFESSKAVIIPVDESSMKDYFGYGIEYYQGDFLAHQIIWTDRNNKFPWDKDFGRRKLFRSKSL